MRNENNSEINWHKLDNTANVFPVISGKNYSSVFRTAVRLREDIDEEMLGQAVKDTLPWFDSFRVKLRRGIFWHYFETNKKQPLVEREQAYPCSYIDPNANNQFLFKVTYFGKRINLEVFHAITDGTGAMKFLKALTYNYLKLAHRDIYTEEMLNLPVVDVVSDVEDSYHKNFRKRSYPRRKTKKAYKIKGEKLPIFSMSIIHGYVNTSALLEICRQKSVSLTQYVAALLIWCIYKEYLNEQMNKNSVQVNIPVNLRQFFDSTTEMNFFSYINVGIKISREGYTFDEMLQIISGQFKNQLTKENLSQSISDNVSTEKNIFVRFAPLMVKNLGVKIAYVSSSKANTIVFSNLGKIEVYEDFKEYIDSFEVLVSVSKSEPIKCTMCSYDDELVFTFNSILRTPYLERTFFRFLSNQGLDVTIESNGVYNEDL